MSVKIFFCYAREDEPLLNKLKTHLMPLQRQGLVDVWHDRNINAGKEWKREIDKHLNAADIILLLISPEFIASDYCYDVEVNLALERYAVGVVRVIPIILRPVNNWQKAPFGELQALPTDGKPITSSFWHNQDEAFSNVAEGIQKVVEDVRRENLLTLQGKISFSALHEIAHLRSDARYAVLTWLKTIDPRYTAQEIPGNRSQLDFINFEPNTTKIGVHVFFHLFELDSQVLTEYFRLLVDVLNEYKFNNFFQFLVYPNSLMASSEFIKLRKSIKPPMRIIFAVGYLEAYNDFQLIGTIPKEVFGL